MKDLENIFKDSNIDFAIQFGSTATGQNHKNSDVDIAVFVDQKIKKLERFEIKLGLMTKLGKHYKKNMDIVILNDTNSLFFKYVSWKKEN